MGHQKKKKKSNFFSNLILLLCIIVFCFSAYKLVSYLTEYKRGEQEYSELSTAVSTEAESEKTSEQKENPPKVDFQKLKAINPDIISWICIDGTVINYPVVQGSDNEYYLHRTFENQSNFSGAIFLDAKNQSDFSSDNSIVYGHNLKTGKMFGSLKYYEDKEYWKDHPYIWIITEEESIKYHIFASYRTSVNDFVYVLEFGTEEEFADYLTKCQKASYYDTGIEIGTDDSLLTLSTCTSDSEDGRRVVQAKKVYAEEN